MNIGDKIPEILGMDQDGKEIKASDYRGHKIVLYSYPKATPADAQQKPARCRHTRKNWLLPVTTLLV